MHCKCIQKKRDLRIEYSLPYSINKKSYNHELMKMYVLSILDNYGLGILVDITMSLTL